MFQIHEPVEFNLLKHHRGYIRFFIENASPASLPGELKQIGGSQMDLYCGPLTVQAIQHEIIALLKEQSVFLPETYSRWLDKKNGYAGVALSDTSRWVLRKGVTPARYIHIHPARYSPHTVRVQANVLKTVVACCVCLRQGVIAQPDLTSVNRVRAGYLGLSPVAALKEAGAIGKIMAMMMG